MKPIKNFLELLGLSHREILMKWGLYSKCFVVLFLLNLTIAIPWGSLDLGIEYAENVVNFFTLIFSLIVGVNIVLIEKSQFKKKAKETVFYQFPTFLIYTLYSGLIALIAAAIVFGIYSAVVAPGPGILLYLGYGIAGVVAFVMGVFFSMSPLNAILIDSDHINYLKESFKMGKSHFGLLFLYTVCTFITELPEFGIYLIDNLFLRLAVGVGYALVDTWFVILVLKLGVKIFYQLYEKRESLSLI